MCTYSVTDVKGFLQLKSKYTLKLTAKFLALALFVIFFTLCLCKNIRCMKTKKNGVKKHVNSARNTKL